jgi:hypothetical protein
MKKGKSSPLSKPTRVMKMSTKRNIKQENQDPSKRALDITINPMRIKTLGRHQTQSNVALHYQGYPFERPKISDLQNNPNKLELTTALLLMFKK